MMSGGYIVLEGRRLFTNFPHAGKILLIAVENHSFMASQLDF